MFLSKKSFLSTFTLTHTHLYAEYTPDMRMRAYVEWQTNKRICVCVGVYVGSKAEMNLCVECTTDMRLCMQSVL